MAQQRKAQRKRSAKPRAQRAAGTTNLQQEFLSKAEARLKELEPLVTEHEELTAAVAALKGNANGGSSAGGASGRTRSASATRSTPAASSRKGRPKGSGKRAQQVLEAVKAAGPEGATVAEIGRALKMDKPQYLYKVVPTLADEDKLVKDGAKYKLPS